MPIYCCTLKNACLECHTSISGSTVKGSDHQTSVWQPYAHILSLNQWRSYLLFRTHKLLLQIHKRQGSISITMNSQKRSSLSNGPQIVNLCQALTEGPVLRNPHFSKPFFLARVPQKTLLLAKKQFYCPQMAQDKAQFLGSCDKCLLHKLN